MKVAVIGNQGSLAQALQLGLKDHCVTSYSKEQYNLTQKENVEQLAKLIFDKEVIVYCSGIINYDCWDTFIVNSVGPAYLLELLTNHESKAHVIIIGSHSSMWTSWPNISLFRLSYNNSKLAIKEYVTGLEQSKKSNLKLTIFNPSRFKSTMSDHTGYPIEYIVDTINYIIKSEVTPLVYELGTPND
jgi:putative NADH-flavin reductase